MKIKVSEASGPVLDWMVCEATGLLNAYPLTRKRFRKQWSGASSLYLHPSTDWAQGGPIIEREGIELERADRWQSRKLWIAQCGTAARIIGPTPLVAALRCYCISKLGEEVEVPNELTNPI